MTDKHTLDRLTYHVDKLSRLLRHPQPGLVTWCQALAQHMQALADYWDGKWVDRTEELLKEDHR